VHADELAAAALRDAGCPAHEPFPAFGARQRHDHSLACLPGLADAVTLPILLDSLLDLVGDPEQGELAQGAEVAGPEEVAERAVDAVGRVDVAAGEARSHGLGSEVDELHLLGLAHYGVGDRLLLRYAGDLRDHVV